ncbi:hypothetical protein [Dictyobacter aurantiacus]|uniref:Uncharacterized protein n=1 Tax=Dictyobacter aurantiacus TaxID=1936993 RepID=A0A401ZR53_9CHLR|nr:hypothetical protein [Dictyobacter aurantiacus]GCE09246.1 hypothetical protein KDAU_65750 [Dictyobacter aurantiacus]
MLESDVAQLRERIATEIEAMNQALNGYASVAQHRVINRKYTQLGTYQVQLSTLVGPTDALKILTEELDAHASDGLPASASSYKNVSNKRFD